jgi:MFS family permease
LELIGVTRRKNSPRISLISAFFVHAFVEIPFFVYPVILVLVGADLFQDLGPYKWLGLGSLGTIASLAAGLPSPIFGWLSDRYRRGKMMFFSLILGSLGSLVIGLFGESFLAMMIGIGLTGLGVSLYHPPGLSWVSTAFEDPENQSYSSHYNRILGIHGVGGTMGAATAPLSVFFLIDTIGWRQIYILWSIPLFFLAIGFWVLIGRFESPVEISSNFKEDNISLVENDLISSRKGNHHTMIIIFAFMIAFSLSFGMTSFILAPFLSEVKGFEISQAAFFVGVSHLLSAIGQLLGGVLGDRYGEKFSLCFATSLQVIVLACIYLVDSSLILFVLYILLSVVNTIFWPSTNSLLAKTAARRGSAFGWFMLTVNVVKALGPGIDGLLISINPINEGYFLIFVMAILFSIIAIIFLLFLRNNKRKDVITTPFSANDIPLKQETS